MKRYMIIPKRAFELALLDTATEDSDNLSAVADILDSLYSPACGWRPGYLGQLGKLAWFRCWRCGMEFNRS